MLTVVYNEIAYEKAGMDLLAKEGWTVLYGPAIDRDYRYALLPKLMSGEIDMEKVGGVMWGLCGHFIFDTIHTP